MQQASCVAEVALDPMEDGGTIISLVPPIFTFIVNLVNPVNLIFISFAGLSRDSIRFLSKLQAATLRYSLKLLSLFAPVAVVPRDHWPPEVRVNLDSTFCTTHPAILLCMQNLSPFRVGLESDLLCV